MINHVLHDRYLTQSLLGHKKSRRTFLAKDLDNQSLVVIKLLLLGNDFAWEDFKLFEREAEVLKSLNSPAIPRYLDFFEAETEWGKGFALVQNYIEAKSLQEWVQAGRVFSQEDIKGFAKQLLEILDYLHLHQPPVIHRDIKPSNILLGDRSGNHPGKIYLVDFGSVQTASHEGGTITIVGTYGYMPPEQFGGRALPASDLYSLGATLIYLIAGQHPADLLQDDLRINLKPVAQNNFELTAWLECLTEPSLKERFGTAAEALKSLEQPPTPVSSQIPPPKCSKYLVTKTTEIFHWVVPATTKLLDVIDAGYRWCGGGALPTLHTHISLILYVIWAIVSWSFLIWIIFSLIVALGPWAIGFSILFTILIVWGGFAELAQDFRQLVEPLAETHFKIDQNRILIAHYFLGKSWHTLNARREDVQKICFTPKYLYGYASSETEGVEGSKKVYSTERKATLELWSNHKKFPIPGTYRFNDRELEWLAQELSTFLGVELEVTPIIGLPTD
jgi:serine/threonine protein kinase